MQLRAIIQIDLDAESFAEAADHQSKVEALFAEIKASYSQAQLVMRQRRAIRNRRHQSAGLTHFTGRMADYEDA